MVILRSVVPAVSCNATSTPAMPLLSDMLIAPEISPYGVRHPSVVAELEVLLPLHE